MVYGGCYEKRGVRFSDMVDYTELKQAVNLELTIVSNVRVRVITSIFSFGI